MSICISAQPESIKILHICTRYNTILKNGMLELRKILCDDRGSETRMLHCKAKMRSNALVLSESGFARVADDDLWS